MLINRYLVFCYPMLPLRDLDGIEAAVRKPPLKSHLKTREVGDASNQQEGASAAAAGTDRSWRTDTDRTEAALLGARDHSEPGAGLPGEVGFDPRECSVCVGILR